MPIAQSDIRTRSLILRTVGDPTEAVSAVRAAVWAVDATLPIYDVETMETVVENRISGFAVIGTLMGVFAILSLILGAVGIYGVNAYAAGQRTSEIGVRIALGAERADVVRMVVAQGARRAVIGLVVGLTLAVAMGRGDVGHPHRREPQGSNHVRRRYRCAGRCVVRRALSAGEEGVARRPGQGLGGGVVARGPDPVCCANVG